MLILSEGTPPASLDEQYAFIEKLVPGTILAVDTERDPDTKQSLGISCALPTLEAMCFPTGLIENDANITDDVFNKLIDGIKRVKVRIFHNAPHDLEDFVKMGVFLDGPFICTQQLAHMVDENIVSKKLDYLHKYVVGGKGKTEHPLMKKMKETMGWRYIPAYLFIEYSIQDAIATMELFSYFYPRYTAQFGPLFSWE